MNSRLSKSTYIIPAPENVIQDVRVLLLPKLKVLQKAGDLPFCKSRDYDTARARLNLLAAVS